MQPNTPPSNNSAALPKPPVAEPSTAPTTATNNPTAEPVKPDRPPKQGVSQMELRWAKTVPDLLGYAGFWLAGVTLLNLKRRLPEEDWLGLAEKFEPETLRMLLKIGANKALANPQHLGLLPFSLTALHALAHLDRATIEQAISQRSIRPQMTEAQAREFVGYCQAVAALPTPPPFDAQKEVSKLTKQMMDQMEKWPADQRGRGAELLLGLADQLRAGLPPGYLSQVAEFSVKTCDYEERGQPAPVKKPTITWM